MGVASLTWFTPSAEGDAGAALGDADFQYLRDFVVRECGISLGEKKRDLLQGRLSRRLAALGLKDFGSYCDLLRRDPESELGELASAVSTNVTSFFREQHHFDLLANELLPAWLARKRRTTDRLRIWSAGCSTGEEPYALAMVLAEALEQRSMTPDAKILATDLSPQALACARTGVYPVERLAGIDALRRKRWMMCGVGENAGMACVRPRLRELVTIELLNLVHDWPMRGPFDAIFCRNVVIYFDQPTKDRLLRRFSALLPAGGYLFLGHSESINGRNDDFELIGRTVYRKRGG